MRLHIKHNLYANLIEIIGKTMKNSVIKNLTIIIEADAKLQKEMELGLLQKEIVQRITDAKICEAIAKLVVDCSLFLSISFTLIVSYQLLLLLLLDMFLYHHFV